MQVTSNTIKAEAKTAVPPIPLPNIDGVTFLSTAGAVREEGSTMQHCVASYAKRAVEGRCYLFHIEYEGDHATAEITEHGKLKQIHGPKNQDNKATEWGKKALSKWSEEFIKSIPLIPKPMDHYFGNVEPPEVIEPQVIVGRARVEVEDGPWEVF
jgi:hypothetical protein